MNKFYFHFLFLIAKRMVSMPPAAIMSIAFSPGTDDGVDADVSSVVASMLTLVMVSGVVAGVTVAGVELIVSVMFMSAVPSSVASKMTTPLPLLPDVDVRVDVDAAVVGFRIVTAPLNTPVNISPLLASISTTSVRLKSYVPAGASG